MDDLDYFNYLMKRTSLKKFLRREIYLKPVVKEINGLLLDVGCGIGEIMQMYYRSDGIDINSFCVRHCQQQGLDVTAGNIYNIPHDDNVYSTVLCSNVLEHLDDPDRAFSEMRRVLKWGGRLIVAVPMAKAYKKDSTHQMFHDAASLTMLFVRHGFTVVKSFYLPVDNLGADNLPLFNGELVMIGNKNSEYEDRCERAERKYGVKIK